MFVINEKSATLENARTSMFTGEAISYQGNRALVGFALLLQIGAIAALRSDKQLFSNTAKEE
jgi:hypothetical protein